jgi:Rieske Fe-S protein
LADLERTDRRGFLSGIIKVSALLIGAITVLPGAAMLLSPVIFKAERKRRKVLFGQPEDATSTTFVAARLEGTDEAAAGVFVKRGADGKPVVLSSICTHAGCAVVWKADQNKFHCPCHQGFFDADGRNVGGPPPRPLTRLAVVEKGGELFVEDSEA